MQSAESNGYGTGLTSPVVFAIRGGSLKQSGTALGKAISPLIQERVMKLLRGFIVLTALLVPVVGSAQIAPVRWEYAKLIVGGNLPIRWYTADRDSVLTTTDEILAAGHEELGVANKRFLGFLNVVGAQGWELIEVLSAPYDAIYLFKRRKT
jgi:hypothetical protein